MPITFIIVADRGRLRMFSLDNSTEHPHLQPITDLRQTESHLKAGDKYSDRAGSFGNTSSAVQSTGAKENMGIELEEEKRLFTRIGQQITTLLQEHGAQRWLFAASAEINAAILDHVDPVWHASLERNIYRDLVHLDGDALQLHFGILEQPASFAG